MHTGTEVRVTLQVLYTYLKAMGAENAKDAGQKYHAA